jgi:hypothetical protein
MTKFIGRTIAAAVLGVIANSQGFAHHSFTMVDRDRQMLIEGKVVEWHFNSPHAWLYIEAPDASGAMVRWGVEGGAPVFIVRQGVKGDSFRLGEPVRIVMSPLRDGRPAGGVCFVEKEDGAILMFNDGSCAAPAVLEKWKQNGWLENGKHLDEHANQ